MGEAHVLERNASAVSLMSANFPQPFSASVPLGLRVSLVLPKVRTIS
jgi:hypothetical protein